MTGDLSSLHPFVHEEDVWRCGRQEERKRGRKRKKEKRKKERKKERVSHALQQALIMPWKQWPNYTPPVLQLGYTAGTHTHTHTHTHR